MVRQKQWWIIQGVYGGAYGIDPELCIVSADNDKNMLVPEIYPSQEEAQAEVDNFFVNSPHWSNVKVIGINIEPVKSSILSERLENVIENTLRMKVIASGFDPIKSQAGFMTQVVLHATHNWLSGATTGMRDVLRELINDGECYCVNSNQEGDISNNPCGYCKAKQWDEHSK